MFLRKNIFLKNIVSGAIILVLAAALAGCSNPSGGGGPTETPFINSQPRGGNFAIGTNDEIRLTVTAFASGKLTYQWYSNTSNATTGGALLSGETSSTLTLTGDDFFGNGNHYYYVTITNEITDIGGGVTTKTTTSNTAAVTVSGVEYTTIAMPENLKGAWTSNWGEEFTISATTFTSGYGGDVTYEGSIVSDSIRGRNSQEDSGYLTIKYTTATYYPESVGNFYVIHWKNLTADSIFISGASSGAGNSDKDEAEAALTVENGEFKYGSSCEK